MSAYPRSEYPDLFLLWGTAGGYLRQYRTHWGDPPSDLVDHAAVITYARGLGAAFIKTSALFLGFILIFTGTLYVLRTAEAAYEIHVASGKSQGYLQTTSPGLVIVSLGVVLTVVTILTKSDLDYQKTTETGNTPAGDTAAPNNLIRPGTWSVAPPNPGVPRAATGGTGH